MKIDEYDPVMRPTSRARAKSCSATAPRIPAPTTSSDSTGSTAARLVLSERISTWFIDTLMMSSYGSAGAGEALRVLVDLVEHDDRVVQRETEDGQERDDRRRRDLELEDRVDADTDQDVVDHGDDRADGHSPLEPPGDEQRDEDQEDDEGADGLLGDLACPTWS